MADLVQTGLDWLAEQRAAHMSRDVTYQRRGASVTVAATVGRTRHEVTTDRGVAYQHDTRDYLVTASALVLDGETILPEAGDLVIEAAGHIYEVAPPDPDLPVYEHSSGRRTTLRIHTRFLRTEP